jgi:outer membrane protein TolC
MNRAWIILGALSLIALPAGAADQPLTWNDCVRLAARNNPDLLSALQALESDQATYKGSFNGILPHVSLTNSYSDSRFSRTGVLGNGLVGTVAGESKQWNAEASANLRLIDFGEWANIQTASASLQEGRSNLRVAASQVLLDLYQAFAAVLYSQDAIVVNKLIRDTWKDNAQMVSLRYQSGRESKGNQMNTQAQLLQADSAVDQAGRDLRVAQQQLGQAIGQDAFNTRVVTGTWTTASLPSPAPNFDALADAHPRLQAQAAVVQRARAGIKSAHSTLWPAVSLSYRRGVQGETELPSDPYWTFGGVLSIPIFAGGPTAAYYTGVAAQRDYDKARLDLRSLRNQLRSDLEIAWAAYARAQDQVRVQKAFLQASRQRKEESDVRYQSGLMTFDNWILVVQDYVNSQTSFLKAEQNLVLAEAQWRFASGEQLTSL